MKAIEIKSWVSVALGSGLHVLEVKPEHRLSRGRYWRPDGHGYTDDITQAGFWTAQEAPTEAEETSVLLPVCVALTKLFRGLS